MSMLLTKKMNEQGWLWVLGAAGVLVGLARPELRWLALGTLCLNPPALTDKGGILCQGGDRIYLGANNKADPVVKNPEGKNVNLGRRGEMLLVDEKGREMERE